MVNSLTVLSSILFSSFLLHSLIRFHDIPIVVEGFIPFANFKNFPRSKGTKPPEWSRNHRGKSPLFTNLNHQESTKSPLECPEIFILSYDGVVADTNDWRSNLAISVAFETWPRELYKYSSLFESNEDIGSDHRLDWLRNKLSALMHVTLMGGEDGMVGSDAVLLTRLILEEQELDGGRSNGSVGKYGSVFHPSSMSLPVGNDDDDDDDDDEWDSNSGSRPLTVGEIAANWNEGACLKDTVRIKYNIKGKDPMPTIRQNILKFLHQENQEVSYNSRHLYLLQIIQISTIYSSHSLDWCGVR